MGENPITSKYFKIAWKMVRWMESSGTHASWNNERISVYLLNCFCPGIGRGAGSLLKVITATSLSLCQRHLQCVSHPEGFVLSYCLAGSLLSCHRKGPATDKGYYPGYHCLIRGHNGWPWLKGFQEDWVRRIMASYCFWDTAVRYDMAGLWSDSHIWFD